jgi:hypothetical protein
MSDNNLDYISNNIFSFPVLPPKSILLEFDNTPSELSEILTSLAFKGTKILWNKNSFLELTQEEFQILQMYFNSFGFKIIVTCNNNQNIWETTDEIKNIFIKFKLI